MRDTAAGAMFARTVVFVAEMLDIPPGEWPLEHGDSGGPATQRISSGGRRLHSLVAARAYYLESDGKTETKRWFVLLVPIHFVVAQLAELMKGQGMKLAAQKAAAAATAEAEAESEEAGAAAVPVCTPTGEIPASGAVSSGAVAIEGGGTCAPPGVQQPPPPPQWAASQQLFEPPPADASDSRRCGGVGGAGGDAGDGAPVGVEAAVDEGGGGGAAPCGLLCRRRRRALSPARPAPPAGTAPCPSPAPASS